MNLKLFIAIVCATIVSCCILYGIHLIIKDNSEKIDLGDWNDGYQTGLNDCNKIKELHEMAGSWWNTGYNCRQVINFDEQGNPSLGELECL